MNTLLDLKSQQFTFFGKGSKIQGQFFLNGPTHLSSIIEGQIVMEDQALLCIEKYGEVTGVIAGHDIEIYGKFEGEVKATGRVTIHPPAVVKGQIHSHSLVVYPGAELNSEIHCEF